MSLKEPLLDNDWSSAAHTTGHQVDITGLAIDTTGLCVNSIANSNHHPNGSNQSPLINTSHTNQQPNHYLMNYTNNTTATNNLLNQSYHSNNGQTIGGNGMASSANNNSSSSTKQLMSAIGMSSSSDSSTDDIVIPMHRRKAKQRFSRKRRSRSTDSGQSIKSRALLSCPAVCLKIVLILLIISTVAFTVLFISKLYDRIDSLQTAINDLSNSGNGIPQELHSIHSHMKTLDGNISAIKLDVIRAFDSIDNLTQEVKQMKIQMSKIADSVEAAPAIRQLPKELQDLQKMVAEMGSRLTTNDNEIKTMKDKQNTGQTRADSVQNELSLINGNLTDLYGLVDRNNGTINAAKVDQNAQQLSQMADSLVHLKDYYKQLINWRTDTDAKLKTVLNLTQNIHDKLGNHSLNGHNTGAQTAPHVVSHDQAINDDQGLSDPRYQLTTQTVLPVDNTVPVNQTIVS